MERSLVALNGICQAPLTSPGFAALYPVAMSIGARFRQLRLANKMPQEQFGDLVGVTKGMVSQWESGTSMPSTDKLVTLGRTLDFSMGWLLNGKGPPPNAGDDQQALLAELFSAADERGRATILLVAKQEAAHYQVIPEASEKSPEEGEKG